MYTVVVETSHKTEKSEKSIRLPLEGVRYQKWEAMLTARKAEQQDALYCLIDWFVEQPPIVQLMILNKAPPEPGLIEYVLKHLPKQKPGPSFSTNVRGGKNPSSNSAGRG